MLNIGRIAKPHGLRGEAVVELFTNRHERLDKGSILETDNGPLTVQRSSPHQHRWIVAFRGSIREQAADELRDLVLRAEPIEDPDALWIHELVGAPVHLTDGTAIGKVDSVIAGAAGDILELDTGALVPLRFVVEQTSDRVVIDPPEGLLEVND